MAECVRPVARIIGATGNIFSIIGIAARALRAAGQRDRAGEMTRRAMHAGSYQEALAVVMEYVDAAGVDADVTECPECGRGIRVGGLLYSGTLDEDVCPSCYKAYEDDGPGL